MTETKEYPQLTAIPTHVGMIMDGNGRWAKAKGLPRLAGHRAGTENIREIVQASVDFGVKVISLYAFSTENWGRPEKEVTGLMGIFSEVFEKELKELHKQNVRIVHIGRKQGIPKNILQKIERGEEITKDNTSLTLCLAFNYGGRNEIRYAIQNMINEGLAAEDITDELISDHMFTKGIPDPDFIIRTSGEQRTSNFLVWQSVYAEWAFPEVYWPDFNKNEYYKALKSFADRNRRFGKL